MKKIILSITLITISMAAYASDVPSSLPYQGNLTDSAGLPVNADYPIEVRLYDSLIAGLGSGVDNSHVIYAERHDSVHIENGTFRISIGDGTSLDPRWTALPVNDLLAKENVYLELWIDGERLSPRQRMGSVPAVVKAQSAKYADSLTHIPSITPEMMPSYNADKITSGTFSQTQVPGLTPAWFTSGTLPASTIPNLDTNKFITSTGVKIPLDRLPRDMDVSKITGNALPLDRLPADIVLDSDIAIGSGTIGDHQMVVLPSDFSAEQCKIAVSAASLPGTAEDGLQYLNVSIDSSNVVSCTYYGNEHPEQPCSANYIYACKK